MYPKTENSKVMVFDNFEDCRLYDRYANINTYRIGMDRGIYKPLNCKEYYNNTAEGRKRAKQEVGILRAMHLRGHIEYENEMDFLPPGYSEDWEYEIRSDIVERFSQNVPFSTMAYQSQMDSLQTFYKSMHRMNWMWAAAINLEAFHHWSDLQERHRNIYGSRPDYKPVTEERLKDQMARNEILPKYSYWNRCRYVYERFNILHKCFRQMEILSESGYISAIGRDGTKVVVGYYGPKYDGIEKVKSNYQRFTHEGFDYR